MTATAAVFGGLPVLGLTFGFGATSGFAWLAMADACVSVDRYNMSIVHTRSLVTKDHNILHYCKTKIVIGSEKMDLIARVGLLFNNVLTAHWYNYTDIIVMWKCDPSPTLSVNYCL